MKKTRNIEEHFGELNGRLRTGNCTMDELNQMQTMLEDEASMKRLSEQMISQLEDDGFSNSHQFKGKQLFERIQRHIQYKNKVVPRIVRFNRKEIRLVEIAALFLLAFVFGGLVTYFISSENKSKIVPPSYCEVVAPLGSITQLVLPDSSVVWLNAGSKVRYSTRFSKDNRYLELEGEGYFKVNKNKELPFLLDVFGFEVKAIGAEFNVKAYPNDAKIETFLVEGKALLSHRTVKIADQIYLNRKFRATFYKAKEIAVENGGPQLIISPNNDPFPYTSWKDDKFALKNELPVINQYTPSRMKLLFLNFYK